MSNFVEKRKKKTSAKNEFINFKKIVYIFKLKFYNQIALRGRGKQTLCPENRMDACKVFVCFFLVNERRKLRMKKFYLVMKDRKLITEVSSKLAESKVFQFVGLSHNIEEAIANIDAILKTDIVLVENCFSENDAHDFIKAANVRIAACGKGKRLYKALVAEPNSIQESDVNSMGYDILLSTTDTQTKMANKLYSRIFSNTCHLLDKYISKIISDGIDINGFNEELSSILHSVGIPASLLGYKFLKVAIEMAFINIDCVTSGVTKIVYPTIALMYKTSPTKVERGIRHAVESGWQRADVETMDKIFSYSYSNEKGKPTNGEFIANIADYLLVKFRAERKQFVIDHAEEIAKINAILDFTDIEDLITN